MQVFDGVRIYGARVRRCHTAPLLVYYGARKRTLVLLCLPTRLNLSRGKNIRRSFFIGFAFIGDRLPFTRSSFTILN